MIQRFWTRKRLHSLEERVITGVLAGIITAIITLIIVRFK